jgi:hypothetical protein
LKTYNHLYAQVCDLKNLYRAFRDARKAKRHKPPVYEFESGLSLVTLRANAVRNLGFRGGTLCVAKTARNDVRAKVLL